MPRDGMRMVEPGQGPWCERMKKKIGKERKNGGERKSQTPVMPRNGMRIEEPGRGPWLGSDTLCRHNFKHNTMDGASSIMPA